MHSPGQSVVFVVSDSVGETAELVVRAAASQFDSATVDIKRVPYVQTAEQILDVVRRAAHSGGAIVYTIVLPELRQMMENETRSRGIAAVDIMGPMLQALSTLLQAKPRFEAGLVRRMDEEYFRRIEAVEFAVRCDDGKDARGLLRADLVIVGVSRTSKTPLSMYLAHRRLKVANVPLIPEIPPPEELFAVPKARIVGLTISPQQLHQIRKERLKSMGFTVDAEYASMERILRELDYGQQVMARLGCPVIDVTNKAVEETAGRVMDIFNRRFSEGG